jgi:CHAT domain-containing protein
MEAARRTGNSMLVARALMYEGFIVQRTGERLARGMRVLREAESLIFPAGQYEYKWSVLGLLGKISFTMGRYDQALSYYSKQIDLARQNNDDGSLVIATHSAITTRRRQLEDLPEEGRLGELTAEAQQLAALADRLGRPALQALANRTLADLVAANPATRAAAEPYYRAALRQARQGTDVNETTSCLWTLGRFLADTDPDESRRLIDDALKMAIESDNDSAIAYAWRQKMRLAWKQQPPDAALSTSFEALKAIETLRTRQAADVSRATVLGAWALDYQWLIGTLLDRPAATRSDLSLAFEIGERMRARLLLDAIEREPSSRARPRSPQRLELLKAISGVQRTLLDPHLPSASRSAALAELDRLEREEAAMQSDATDPVGRGGTFATLDAVERSLGDNEALLTFTVGLWKNFYGNFAGGAWLLVSTNSGTKVVRAPDRMRLLPTLSIFRGLTEQANESDGRVAAKLYELLLGEASAGLPERVNRLIVVSDGPVHHLPFAALHHSAGSPPLGATHDIALVPSATVWLRLRQLSRQPTSDGALVFADPEPPPGARTAKVAEERGWWSTALQVGRLPYSRTEGRAIVSYLGGGSRLFVGAEATEANLKSRDLGAFGILHFATHSVIDEDHPERSAVLLAAGSEADDGLLQPREIADLRLAGKIVVLSSCRSATGAVLAGEGVVGLSHAFLSAGARTVVGTLWPIRDDHAAAFFDAFYESLARGRDVSSALTEARRRAIARGLPASAWSAVVAIGDDAAAVAMSPVAESRRPPLIAWVGLMLLLASIAAVLTGLRRGRARRA